MPIDKANRDRSKVADKDYLLNRTSEEDVPFFTQLKRMGDSLGPGRGRGGDIALPNDSGKKDPRLRTTADDVLEGFHSVRGLIKAAGRK